jgi:hypothetical protein
MLLLNATPGTDHKNDWCHYPPGQWRGAPYPASKVNILSIDVVADSGHRVHSPLLDPKGPPCTDAVQSNCAEGVTLTGKADGCPGGCGTAVVSTPTQVETVTLVLKDGVCVCPAVTPLNLSIKSTGEQPVDMGTLGHPNYSCGTTG